MDNERDSLCAFRMRIATFDSGCVNATAEQEAPPTKDGGIDPKGWCAVRTLQLDRTLQRGGSKRMDNERDSLGAFRLRIATYDSGWVNATAEQDGLLHGFGYK